MTHNHQWRKAVAWEGEEPPNGFERTLSPSDARARAGVPLAGYLVRDNRRGQAFRSAEAMSAASAVALAGPISVTPVSGVVKSRNRAGVDTADTLRDAPPLPYEEPLEITPDFASEYVPPQPLPRLAQHKTFELRPVRLDPQIHPRTAPTELNLRTVKRQQDKLQKDARELAELVAQAELRRRGPWMFVAFALVVAAGFLVGAELVDSAEAEAETRVGNAGPPIAQGPRTEAALEETEKAKPASSPMPSGESPAAVAPESAPRGSAALPRAPGRAPKEPASAAQHGREPVAGRQPEAPRRDQQPDPQEAQRPAVPLKADPQRDVWLK